MRAVAVFPESREVRLVDHPEPELQAPDDVLVRMLEVGVCGTDKEICAFHYGTPPAGSEYLVIGHEGLGEVLGVGEEVEGLRAGDLVVPMVRRPCSHANCPACRAGRQDFCFTGDFRERGIKELHGFLAERIVDKDRYFVRVDAELRETAVLIEPLTIAEKAMRQVWDVQERLPWACGLRQEDRCKALVLGAGPVGILGAMLLAHSGFETWVYSREPAGGRKAQLVERFGGNYLSSEDCSVADLPERIGDIDLVYEACGASGLAFAVLEHLSPNAIFIFTGVPGRKAAIELRADRIMRNLVLKNQAIFGTVNAGQVAFERAVRDLGEFRERWPGALEELITGRYPLEEAEALLAGKRPGIKNVLAVS